MENLKKEFMEKKENKKMVVEVLQKKGIEKEEVVNYWNNEKVNISQLLAFLYRKTILKSNNLKIRYSYNYSDYQTIKIIESYTNYDNTITKTSFVFYNVPTNMAYLDTKKIEEKM